MTTILEYQELDPLRTSWHITFGTYGTRLHGGAAPTVDKLHNVFGDPFLPRDPHREQDCRKKLKFAPVYFTTVQRVFVETEVPDICERGGWTYRVCAAGSDHVHLLCDIAREIHGEKVRRLIKRWLVQSLSERWTLADGATWWAEEGSNKAVRDEQYLNSCFKYIYRQRATESAGAEDGPAH